MAKKLRVNIAQTSSDELQKTAIKSGFLIFHGAKHDKVKTSNGKFVTEIPRHGIIYKPLARKIIEAMNSCGATIEF